MPLEHLELQLRRPPDQEREVETFIEALHDPASPASIDGSPRSNLAGGSASPFRPLPRSAGGLEKYGFRVGPVYPGGMVMDFSGTAAQLSAAFHTSIHQLRVGGKLILPI